MGNKKVYRKLQNSIILTFTIAFLSFISVSAESIKSYKKQMQYSIKWSQEFVKIKNPKLYKKKIEEEINYFQDPRFKDESLKNLMATKLELAYARLFVLEDTCGNKYQADIYFEKSKYWTLIGLECFSSSSAKERIKKLETVTKENMKKFIAKLNPEFYKRVQELTKKY